MKEAAWFGHGKAGREISIKNMDNRVHSDQLAFFRGNAAPTIQTPSRVRSPFKDAAAAPGARADGGAPLRPRTAGTGRPVGMDARADSGPAVVSGRGPYSGSVRAGAVDPRAAIPSDETTGGSGASPGGRRRTRAAFGGIFLVGGFEYFQLLHSESP
jgi:hypothetical protein